MTYRVLARKWRPQNFDQVIGQDHITRSLKNAIINNKIGHAYIFSGTRGIGKTSIARIFAKALRCENRIDQSNACGDCPSCLDFKSGSSMNIYEIDGASNNSVDDVRDLISKIQTLPTIGRYKVYIIDEVHMLSVNAFNALLKTLEEPPEHVIFILATTEPEKLLNTVLSRCQRFDFRNASVSVLLKHLKDICEKEDIQYEDETFLEKICVLGNGSVRDTLSLLDQVLSYCSDNLITEDVLNMSLGLVDSTKLKSLLTAMISYDGQKATEVFRDIIQGNVSLDNLIRGLCEEIYLLIQNSPETSDKAELMWIFETLNQDYNWVKETPLPHLSLELLLQKISLRGSFFNKSKKKVSESENVQSEKTPVETAPIEEGPDTTPILTPQPIQKVSIEKPLAENQEVERAEAETKPVDEVEEIEVKESQAERPKTWDGFLDFLRTIAPAAASNLEQGNIIGIPELSHDGVRVRLAFDSKNKVFFDYLTETEITQRIIGFLSTFFEYEVDQVKLNIDMIDTEEKKRINFQSRADIEEEKIQIENENRRAELRNHPIIKEAEELFNTTVDKVNLTSKGS